MGGGGADSLDSPKSDDNSDFESDKNDDDLSDKIQNDDAGQEDAISKYTYKTYDDYFTDLNITAETISIQDYTGTGSATNPYIVHSTKGFLYLSKNVNFNNKYIELNCNIKLNDEIFDENGNPSGGDGIVYSWQPISTGNSTTYVNGNGYEISGMYYNNNTENHIGLFGYNFSGVLEKVKFKNLYLYGAEYVRAVGTNVKEIKNCSVSGYIKSNKNCAGFSYNSTLISNCQNFAKLSALTGGTVAGISIRCPNNIEKCKNYGDISGTGTVGGICAYDTPVEKNFIGCENYGDVKATTSYYAGGIVGMLYNVQGFHKIIDCKNYGDIFSQKGYVGGICGFVEGYVDIINCYSEGEVNYIDCSGALIGSARAQYGTVQKSYIKIIDCNINYNPVNYDAHFNIIGNVYKSEGKNLKIEIVDCDISIENKCNKRIFVYLCPTHSLDYVLMKNINLNIDANDITPNLTILNKMYSQPKFVFENINIIVKSADNSLELFPTYSASNLQINGIVSRVITPTTEYKTYIGTDFSGFYCDWKTGKIGLKSLNGNGYYQSVIDENILKAKGYEKIA